MTLKVPAGDATWGGMPVVHRLAEARPRTRIMVSGHITAAGQGRIGPARAYMCRLDDGTGKITLAFTGREGVPGMVVGTRCRVEGTARTVEGQLMVCNPEYEFVAQDHPSRHFGDL